MHDIYDRNGNLIASLPLSDQQAALLDKEGTLTVQYHTPQLLRHLLGDRNGTFDLHKDGGRIVAQASGSVRALAALLADAKKARES